MVLCVELQVFIFAYDMSYLKDYFVSCHLSFVMFHVQVLKFNFLFVRKHVIYWLCPNCVTHQLYNYLL